jgi:glutamate/aspartate transport system substrate-binding protein
MNRFWLTAIALAALVWPAAAQDVGRLTGTLAKIQASHSITLGVRDASLPFSYRLSNGTPVGYAVELCQELVDDISAELDGMRLTIVYKTVTAEDRIPRVASGDVDMECGSTTRNAERQKLVAFSPVFFIAGTKLLVARDSPVESYRDLAGKTAVVTAGTTNEGAMHRLVERLHVPITIVTAPDHDQSFALLRAGKAAAFATDDVLLAGLAATPDGAGFHVVGEYLSYEPYGLMFRKDDPGFAAVVQRGFARMAETGRLSQLYTRWLVRRLPTGEILNIPMSAELSEIFRVEGQPD